MNNLQKKILLVFIFIMINSLGCIAKSDKKVNQVCFQPGCFDVEVASNNEKRQRGLQFRTSLGENAGMLFVFNKSRKHSFWMKDTLIALDMIWMDYQRNIVHIEEDVMPCEEDPCPSYTPDKNALYVLEINASIAKKLNLKVGDQAQFILNLRTSSIK